MDRRRFVPSGEGLEGRALLSLFGNLSTSRQRDTGQNVPETWLQKEQRVNHIPFYLRAVDTTRFLPRATVENLQNHLHAVMGELSSPTDQAVTNFDLSIRDAFNNLTISTAEANALNRNFGEVLIKAGATPEQTINLQSDMNQLAFVDAKSINPSILVANDYSLVLQTAIAAGRPIKRPDASTLHANDGAILSNGMLGRTRDHNPTLVGIYNVGLKGNGITDIQIVTANGTVLGTGKITPITSAYTVKVTTTLADGIYNLYTRAIDNQGHLSDLSVHYFKLKVVSPPQHHVSQLHVVKTTTIVTPVGQVGLNKLN
jgi:hypothetical protein